MGSFLIKEQHYATSSADFLLEIKDILNILEGTPSAVQQCVDALRAYQKDPTPSLKAQLKVAYENVPTHLQMFVGDMDTKDTVVRMIIYGDEEIEHWSHYQVAKELGEELPTISIPTTKEEEE